MVPFKGANVSLLTGKVKPANKLHQNDACKNKAASISLCVSERKLFRILGALGHKGQEKQVLDHNPLTKRKIWNQWNLLPEGTMTYIFPQILVAGKLYGFVVIIGGVFSGKLFSVLL